MPSKHLSFEGNQRDHYTRRGSRCEEAMPSKRMSRPKFVWNQREVEALVEHRHAKKREADCEEGIFIKFIMSRRGNQKEESPGHTEECARNRVFSRVRVGRSDRNNV